MLQGPLSYSQMWVSCGVLGVHDNSYGYGSRHMFVGEVGTQVFCNLVVCVCVLNAFSTTSIRSFHNVYCHAIVNTRPHDRKRYHMSADNHMIYHNTYRVRNKLQGPRGMDEHKL
jgi:hypothetical protein